MSDRVIPLLPLLTAAAVVLGSASARAQDEAAFSRCLAGLQGDAQREGVTRATFEQLTAGIKPDPSLRELLDNQPEFRTPIWDYLASLVDDERVADGRAMLAQ